MEEVSTAKRERRSADETRRIVLDAAIALIEEHGTADLKVVDVSRKCGVWEVLIYKYFANRSGLLTAALIELWDRYMAEPVEEARAALEALPDEAITTDLLAGLLVPPSQDLYRRRRWARLQVLAASTELPELAQMIRESQARLSREHESLIEYIQSRMPGKHLFSARMLRIVNETFSFGFILQDVSDDPLTDEEFRQFFHEFLKRSYEPDPR